MKYSVALCVVSATLFVALCGAGPVPAADELQLVQIPLQGNKVSHSQPNVTSVRRWIGPISLDSLAQNHESAN